MKIRHVEFRFLLPHPVNSFKNLVKTHGGILVKTEKKENVTKSNTETELNNPTEFESQVKN